MAPATGLSGGISARLVAGGSPALDPSGGLLKVILRRTSTRGCFEAEATASVGRFNDDDNEVDDDGGLATTTAEGGSDDVGSEDDATPTT